jgi:tRNA (mo5U34)-methyltransferase
VTTNHVLRERKEEDFGQRLAQTGWYHSMELPGGRIIPGFLTLEQLRERYDSFLLPPDLTGKRVLDVGTWDGWFAFEAERRGAEVVAVDLVEQENFHYAHRALNSKVHYVLADVYEIPRLGLGRFDYTLFLGVLYHLGHPSLALDTVCGLTKETAIVDSFVIDGDDRAHVGSPIPWMEFYETDELGNNLDNWVGPTLDCLFSLCRSAGFARVEQRDIRHRHATLARHRRWEPPPERPTTPAPVLVAALNGGNYGINFEGTRLEEFLTCWFTADQEKDLTRELLRPEVAGFGVPALTLRRSSDGKPQFSCRLPPGLPAGQYDVRLRTKDSGFSSACQIIVGNQVSGAPSVEAACDGLTWRPDEIVRDESGLGHLTLWLRGLSNNSDRNNVRVNLNGLRMPVEYVSDPNEGIRQVNAIVAKSLGEGLFPLVVSHGGHETPSRQLRISGRPRGASG